MIESGSVAPSQQQAHSVVNVTKRLYERLDGALDELAAAKGFAKSTYQTNIFQIAEVLMGSAEGMRALYERAHRFDEIGVFEGGPWVNPAKLQPPLVAGGLKAGGVYPVVETLSELRMLAIAQGRARSEVSAEEATAFLNAVMALNLEFIFPGDTEEERMQTIPHRESILRLFALLVEELDLSSLRGDVVSEIEQICAQRPIMTGRVRNMIEMAARIPQEGAATDVERRLQIFTRAIRGPSQLCQRYPGLAEYRQGLKSCDAVTLEKEAGEFAESMTATGLTCPHHAILLRHLRAREPGLIPVALALNERGIAEFTQNRDFALQLVRVAILPVTSQSIYGFARLLEYGLLSRQEVKAGLTRIVELDLQSEVRGNLLARRQTCDGITANALLLAGVIAVFGQPLGVGQGRNPTCQAARAISLWGQHAQGYLLGLLISAARDGFVALPFEGEMIRSDELTGGLATQPDLKLDPVSIVLVPHLDRIYDAMMKRVALRQEDGHKWVNPALYGSWVPKGFASVFA
ncbi:MAG: hypothetical protein R3C68_11435 [Myxococcota bacterium]